MLKSSLLALLGMLLAQGSWATSAPAQLMNTAPMIASDAPAPLPVGDEPEQIGSFKFKDGQALFAKGLIPTEQGLIGAWMMIAWADLSVHFANQKDYYAPEGKKNPDGSITHLEYLWQTQPISGERYFGHKFLNLGNEASDQGPYQSRIDMDRAAVISSVHAYSGGTLSKTYFVFDCRQMHNDSNKLICGVTLHLNAENAPAQQKQFDGVMGGFAVFSRAR